MTLFSSTVRFTNHQKMRVSAPNGRFNGAAESDHFIFIGGDYAWSPQLMLKPYLGFVDERTLEPGAKAGPVNNRNTALMLTCQLSRSRRRSLGLQSRVQAFSSGEPHFGKPS